MKKTLLLVLTFIQVSVLQAQQQPQYMVSPPATAYNIGSTSSPLFSTARRMQNLFYPTEFPGVPKGFVTNLYFKHFATWNPPGDFTYVNFYIGMSYYNGASETGDSLSLPKTLPYSWWGTDTVLFHPSYTVNTPIVNGDWVKFSLQKPFLFDPGKKFILDISITDRLPHSSTFYGISPYGFGDSSKNFRVYMANLPIPPNNIGTVNAIPIFGFDLTPLEVNDLSNLASLNIFPNPSEGKFMLSFNAQKKINEGTLTVTNLMGSVVFREYIQNITGNFSKEVDIRGAAKGVYFVEVKADGERVVRKMVLQ